MSDDVKKGRGRKSGPPPEFKDTSALMTLCQTHAETSASDTSRQFTNEGFKGFGGIDGLPPTTKGFMISSLVLSLANDASSKSDTSEQSSNVLNVVGEFIGSADEQAKTAAKLATYKALALAENLDPMKDGETADEFIARVRGAVSS